MLTRRRFTCVAALIGDSVGAEELSHLLVLMLELLLFADHFKVCVPCLFDTLLKLVGILILPLSVGTKSSVSLIADCRQDYR